MRNVALLLLVAVLVPVGTARADWVLDGTPIVTDPQPRGLVSGDFNGDGRPDLAVAQYQSGSVAVFVGQAGGGFAPEATAAYASGAGTTSVATGDFEPNGLLDLAAANDTSNSTGTGRAFLRISGGFTIEAAPTHPAAYSIAVARLNGDDRADLVLGSRFTDAIQVYLRGDSGFAPEGSPITTAGHKLGLTTADFDRDGDMDVASANDTAGTVSVFLRKPGGFDVQPDIPVGIWPRQILARDFNGDAFPDLAISNYGADTVVLLLGQPAGGFAPAPGSPYVVGDGPLGLASADFDLDGDLDLAVANNGSGNVTVLAGGGGRLTPEGTVSLGAAGAWGVTAADIDADGRTDLAVSNNVSATISLLRNVAPPPPPPPPVNLDADGDRVQRPADCRDDDPTIYPGAVDKPGDGIDQDCIGGDASYPRLRRAVAYGIKYGTAFSVFTSLSVKPGRAGDHIRLRCKGRGCRIGTKVVDVAKDAARISLTKHVRGARMRPGASLEVRITRPGTVGKSVKYTVRSGRKPRKRERCLPPGSATPVKCSA